MSSIGAAILAIFGVYGMMTLLEKLCNILLGKVGGCERIVIYVKGDCKNIEGVVRSLMIKNPVAEIIVTDSEKSDELSNILDKLCQDNTQVHIST